MYDPVNKALSIQGGLSIDDVRQCLGVSSRDLGTLCQHANINKWAKYKPFRSSSVAFSDEDAMKAARRSALYGFSPDPSRQSSLDAPAVLFVNNVMQNVHDSYVYSRPRGVSNSEWFRLLDFDGYNHRAVVGFKLELSTMYYNSVNGAVFYFGMNGPISGFNPINCLSPNDILATSHGDKVVGLLLSREGYANKYFVSTGKTLDQLRGTLGYALFSGQERSYPMPYAVVPVLANEWRGATITAAAVLAPASYSDPSTCYAFNSAWADCISLEFTQNLDRVIIGVTQDTSGMDLSELTISHDAGQTGIHGTTGDWHYYNNMSAVAINVHAETGWSQVAKTVYYEMELLPNGGGLWVSDYSSMEGVHILDTGSFSIASGENRSLSHTFTPAFAYKVYKEFHSGDYTIKVTLSTEPDKGGQTKIFTKRVELGTW